MTAVSQVAADAVKRWLEIRLATRVSAANAARYVEFWTNEGPWTVPTGGMWMGFTLCEEQEISDWSTETVDVQWQPLSAGAYTAAQMASALSVAAYTIQEFSATAVGNRVRIRCLSASSAVEAGRVVSRAPSDASVTATANALLGFDAGGERVVCERIMTPSARGVCDGFPANVPDINSGVWVIIGDREATPSEGSSLRRETWEVRMPLHVLSPARMGGSWHRSRQSIAAVVGVIEDCLLADGGRQLGRSSEGDIVGVEVVGEKIDAQPIQLAEASGAFFDSATIDIVVRVFQRNA